MYCMMQWIKPLSLHIGLRLNIVFFTNNQNRQQNKVVNMVNENHLKIHNYWPYIDLTYVFETQMCIFLKLSGIYIFVHGIYIFK